MNKTGNIKNITLLVYILHVLGFFTAGATALVGIILNYIKLPDSKGTKYHRHFIWQIRTFWSVFILMILNIMLIAMGYLFTPLVFFSFPLGFATLIWAIYRVAKGLINFIDGK